MRSALVTIVAAAACAYPVPSDAADRAASLSGLHGTVMVARAAGMATAAEGERLEAGARVVTAPRAAATIVYEDGCTVALGGNARSTVRFDRSCAELRTDVVVAQASIRTAVPNTPAHVAVAPAVAPAAASAGTAAAGVAGAMSPALAGFGVAAGAVGTGTYATIRRSKSSSSPN
jgi:hypothetical protein